MYFKSQGLACFLYLKQSIDCHYNQRMILSVPTPTCKLTKQVLESEMTFHARIRVILIVAYQSCLDFVWGKSLYHAHFVADWLYVSNDF